MNHNSKHYALITGATSGIGKEIACCFAKDGYNLVIVGRREKSLDQTATHLQKTYDVNVIPLEVDLFDKNAAYEIYDDIQRLGIVVDFLVNDAGQGEWGLFSETDLQRELDIIQLNIVSVVTLTKLFLKEMLERKEGKILQLASMVSKVPSPLMAIYAATKAFIYSFSTSLYEELKGTGVSVTALLPGTTDNDFFHKAHAESTKEHEPGRMDDPAEVAKNGYEAMMRGEHRVVSGLKNKISAFISNVTPDTMLAENMHHSMESKKGKKS